MMEAYGACRMSANFYETALSSVPDGCHVHYLVHKSSPRTQSRALPPLSPPTHTHLPYHVLFVIPRTLSPQNIIPRTRLSVSPYGERPSSTRIKTKGELRYCVPIFLIGHGWSVVGLVRYEKRAVDILGPDGFKRSQIIEKLRRNVFEQHSSSDSVFSLCSRAGCIPSIILRREIPSGTVPSVSHYQGTFAT
jgi:hypothetical protein